MSAKLGIIAVSAGLAALVVALVMPFTQPESLAALANHPLGGAAMNASAAAIRVFARLLVGDPIRGATGPSLRDYYPLNGAQTSSSGAGDPVPELDWADPRVWAAQQDQIREPYYTQDEVSALLHWCRTSTGNATGDGGSCGDGGGGGDSGVGGSGGGQGQAQGEDEAETAARFRRLAEWVTANGGDTSRVHLGVDARGVRGLHATQAIPAGEIALAVPLRLGLSIATFRAARGAAGPTASWRAVEDADLYLDALALAYEVASHGERSPWADYICLLPRRYGGLPVHASDPEAASLLSALPAVRRLAARRRAQLELVGERLAAPTLESLPGGRAAMARLERSAEKAHQPQPQQPQRQEGGVTGAGDGDSDGGGAGPRRGLWRPLWHWAVAATKTRSVALGTEELRAGGGAGAPGEDALPFRMPLAMIEWLQDVGVMLPLFDLANHGFDGEGANVAYQLLPAPSGGGLAACLVARTPIAPGQQLLFDYVAEAEADAGPACADRWLLEYGFVPESADPRRDCDTFHVTAAGLAAAVRAAAAATAAGADAYAAAAADADAMGADRELASLAARLQAAISRLPEADLPSRLEIHVQHPDPWEDEREPGQGQHVRQRWAAVQWLAAALDGVRGGDGGDDGGGAGDVDVDAVLRALLAARLRELEQLEERALEAGGGGGAGAGGSGAGDAELRRGVAAVAAAGRRAVRRALEQERVRGRP